MPPASTSLIGTHQLRRNRLKSRNILFLDESRIKLTRSDGRTRHKKKLYADAVERDRFWDWGSVMVWVGVMHNYYGFSTDSWQSECQKKNKNWGIVLRNHVIPYVNTPKSYIQQDNATSHTTGQTCSLLQAYNVNVLERLCKKDQIAFIWWAWSLMSRSSELMKGNCEMFLFEPGIIFQVLLL